LFGALKDMIVIDKHRMFYRGLPGIVLACMNLECVTEVMHYFRDPLNPYTFAIWPFLFAFGTFFVHPFMLLGMRVQVGPISKSSKTK
jgi:hypothetical protein